MSAHVIIEERDTSTPNPQWHMTSEVVAVYGPFPSYAAASAMVEEWKRRDVAKRILTIEELRAP